MAQSQRILCCDNIRTHFGLIRDTFQLTILAPTAKTNFYYFPNIMTGPQMRPRPYSLIFQVRTVIFGTQPLHPYVGRGFHFLFARRKLIIEPPDGQSHSHSAPNRPDFNVGQSPLEGSVRVLVDWNMVSNASI